MRRSGLLIGGWALATVLALLLGLQSVSAISDSVAGRPRKTLSPASVKAALDRSDSSDDSSSSSESTESSESREDSRSSNSGSSSSSSGQSSSSSDDNDQGPNSSDDNSSGGDGSSSSQAFPAAQNETYPSQGGTVTVRFEGGEAHLVSATANPGFSCEDNSNSSSVDVRCKSIDGSHESRIEAKWDNGPQHTVEEKD